MSLWSNTDEAASKPKYVSDASKADVLGVSVEEATDAANIAKGLNTPGWVKHTTYVDAQGNTRNKSEVLVAMKSITGDADVLPPLPVITISARPQSITVVEPATATFSVTASITGGATLSYQWQKQKGGVGAWSNITGATSTSYTTGATTAADDNGDKYRVVVSGTLGAVSVNSSPAATLTVTA